MKICLFIFGILFFTSLEAEVYNVADFSIGQRTEKEFYKINKDFSYTKTYYFSVKNISEIFLEDFKVIEKTYNKLTTEVELEEVKVCRNSICRNLDTSKIIKREKYIKNGYSSKKSLRYVIDDLRVGDDLMFRITTKSNFKNLGFYCNRILLGKAFHENVELKIDSEIDLFYDINLNNDYTKVKKKTPRSIHIVQLKPTEKTTISKNDDVILRNQFLVDIKSLKFKIVG